MKFAKTLALPLLLFPFFTNAQATMVCPPDLSINVENLDETYSTYGDPIITGGDDWILSKEITTVNNSCENDFALIATITYTIADPNSTASVWCSQVISMTPATFDDVVFPEDITLSGVKVSDAQPSLTGTPNILENLSNLVFAFNDTDPIVSGNKVTIIRNWTVLSWCTGQSISHEQIIIILDPLDETSNGAFAVDCSGLAVSIDDVIITTNDPNVAIDPSGCSLTSGSIVDHINCVVAKNPIADGFEYNADIIKNDGHLNGISTLDIVITQRHILGIEKFDNPCQIIAADLSNNGNVSAIDLLESRKLILGIYTVLPNSPSWKFMRQSVNGLTELRFPKEEFPLPQIGITAIKIGDVNGSAVGN